MDRITKKIRIFIIAFCAFSLVLFLSVNFTDAIQLETLKVDNAEITNWEENYAPLQKKSVISQESEILAESMLKKNDIYKVEIVPEFPNRINIYTNQFEPEAFLLDSKNNRLVGIDKQLRVFPLDNIKPDWEQPVVSGIKISKMYSRCLDPNAEKLIKQLISLKEQNVDLFRMIDEIQLINGGKAVVRLAGIKFKVIVPLRELKQKMKRLAVFLTRYQTDMEKIKKINLCFDEMIIVEQRKI